MYHEIWRHYFHSSWIVNKGFASYSNGSQSWSRHGTGSTLNFMDLYSMRRGWKGAKTYPLGFMSRSLDYADKFHVVAVINCFMLNILLFTTFVVELVKGCQMIGGPQL